MRQTQFSDVCGTMDELKRRLYEDYSALSDDPAGGLNSLLEDARFMLDRMQARLDEYRRFRDILQDLLIKMDQVEPVSAEPARKALGFLHTCAATPESFSDAEIADIARAAEDIRLVAATQEIRLRTFMDLALAVRGSFDAIRGNRPWVGSEAEAASLSESLARRFQAWLPPEPHRSRLLEFLAASRAVISENLPGEEPVVAFEDGGSILMSQVRWSEAIENFHPANTGPGPTGLRYRG
ncbi:MAG: hypothetical protein IT210_13690 [Armatimonadetes bacterium]|nr:hypothetical protein [Armatimonadota bacterium]